MKNKIIAILAISFAIGFMIFVARITANISNSKQLIIKSPNVIDVTELITTDLLVTDQNLPLESSWTKSDFVDSDWTQIKIPSYQIVQNQNFKAGNFAYYRIKLPKKAFSKLKGLQYETSLALMYIFFSRLDIIVNGNIYRTNKPKNSIEANVILPVIEDQDNIICIKGYIAEGDSGIDHRDKILLGKSGELNELYNQAYKAQTVFQLIFILCKGSILFIFALIYLILNVHTSFEKFFIFGLCAVVEELIAGEYLYGPLNFNQMVYLYNFVNVGAACAAFLFFEELLNQTFSSFIKKTLSIVLLTVSWGLAVDALHWNYFVNLTNFMKFWNLITVSIMLFYLPKTFKFNRSLFCVLSITIILYIWGALFTNNIGLNLKAYGNLLLFIMVAYQTFVIFRREQIQLQVQERQLLEQEKDVAIGKTASLLAHDVRKPLEQMKLVIEKMAEGIVDKEFLAIAKKDIDFSIGNVTQQVNDIMNYSKSSDVQLKETNFYRILSHSLKQVMSSHPEMDIELTYDFKSNNKVLADEPRLAGVLVNLISNAVEAIRDIGGRYNGKIKFSTINSSNTFTFKIFNDGPKIPPSIINDIFKPLFTHGKAGGTGLGLASVQKAISEHRGTIKVENVDSGVQFTIILNSGVSFEEIDLQKFQQSSKAYSYSNIKPPEETEKSDLRVLILEDDPNSIRYFESFFSKMSFKARLVFSKDRDSAKKLIQKSRFDFYFLCIELEGQEIHQTDLNFLHSEVFLYNRGQLPTLDEAELKKIYDERIKVLLVDDTKLFRLAWQMFHGEHNIVCLSSPEEALNFIKESEQKIDVCVLDYHFSNSSMNGEELGKSILAILSSVKILISSSIEQTGISFDSINKRNYELREIVIKRNKIFR